MLDFDNKARTADYNSIHESYQNDTKRHQMGQNGKRRPIQTEYYAAHCSSDQQEQTLMVWPCHEERRRLNADGCEEVKYEGKEMFRESKRLEDIDFLIN